MKENQKGTAIIEAAFTLPILLLIFLGIIEFGSILMIQQTLTNAAREGARGAAVLMDNTQALTAAESIAENYLDRSGIDVARATVSPVFSNVNGTQAIEVNINYPYSTFLTGWVPGLSDTLDLRSRAVMRREA